MENLNDYESKYSLLKSKVEELIKVNQKLNNEIRVMKEMEKEVEKKISIEENSHPNEKDDLEEIKILNTEKTKETKDSQTLEKSGEGARIPLQSNIVQTNNLETVTIFPAQDQLGQPFFIQT